MHFVWKLFLLAKLGCSVRTKTQAWFPSGHGFWWGCGSQRWRSILPTHWLPLLCRWDGLRYPSFSLVSNDFTKLVLQVHFGQNKKDKKNKLLSEAMQFFTGWVKRADGAVLEAPKIYTFRVTGADQGDPSRSSFSTVRIDSFLADRTLIRLTMNMFPGSFEDRRADFLAAVDFSCLYFLFVFLTNEKQDVILNQWTVSWILSWKPSSSTRTPTDVLCANQPIPWLMTKVDFFWMWIKHVHVFQSKRAISKFFYLTFVCVQEICVQLQNGNWGSFSHNRCKKYWDEATQMRSWESIQ